MKASLKLDNIGQLVGPQILEFNSGIVTLITGRTATGKSRIIKSCALALSYPIISDTLIVDGINFGILKSEAAEFLPLVNSSKEKATIELSYDKLIKKVELFRNGKITTNNPGNQKFLYSSMLVKNSRIHNNITHGNADFRWIVDEMSLAKDYEKILNINQHQINNLNSSYDEIKANRELIGQKEKEKKANVEAKKKLIKELKEQEVKIENYEFDEEAVIRENALKKELSEYKNGLASIKEEKVDNEKLIKELKEKIKAKTKIEKIRNEVAENNLILEDLKSIDIEALQKEIINLQKLKSKEEQGKVRVETTLELWKKVNIEEGNKCPLCQSVGKITEEKRRKEIDECTKKLKKFQPKIEAQALKINEKQTRINQKAKLKRIEKDVEKGLVSIELIDRDAKNSLEKIKPAEQRQKVLIEEEQNYEQNKVKCEEYLKKTQEEMKQEAEYQQMINEKSKIERNIGMNDEKTLKIDIAIKEAKTVEVYTKRIDLDLAEQILEEFLEILEKTKNYLESRIKEQREGAANKFNESIKNLIKELKFEAFKEIYLDLENYRLKIVDNHDNSQELSSVSGGEKVIISSLLQISAKETYLSDIPFLIGDEIILDLDQERSEIFINYLKKIAREKDWFIILTQITNDDLKIIEI